LLILSGLFPIVRDNVIPFLGGRARDESDDWFRVAHVEDLMRDAGFDVNEIAGFVFQDLFQASAEFVTDFSFDDVKDDLKTDVNVGGGDTTWRDRRDIR
jgi:hypothetical protein